MPEEKCVICKTPKELSKFRKKFTNSDGRESVCIECWNERKKEYDDKRKTERNKFYKMFVG